MTLLRRPRDPDHTKWRVVRVALRAAAVAAAALVVGAAPASAHANLERSDPPNGGMIVAGRTTLTLWYGEPITAAGSSFTVQRTDGAAGAVPTTSTLDEGGTVVHLTIPPLENGTYTLTWAVTATDGHPTRGTVVFGSGFRPDGVASADTSAPAPFAVLLRIADLGGGLLALGSLVVAGRVLTALGPIAPRIRRRVLTAGALGATVALAGALANPVLTAYSQLGEDGGDVGQVLSAVRDVVLTSTWGLLWVVRVLALVVAYLFLWRARAESAAATRRGGRPDGWRAAGKVAAVGLVVAVSVDAWSGHASTLPARSALTAVAAAAHVLAASVWAGGLLVLVLAVVPIMRLDGPQRRAVSPAVWRAFSPLAAVSVGVLLATGLYEASQHVETLDALTDGIYGWGVVAKVGLLGVALALAGYNTLVVNPGIAARVGGLVGLGSQWRPRPRPLAVTVTVEAMVLLLATGVAAVMTSTPTAREVAAASAVTVPHSDTVDGLFVTAETVPTGSRLRVVVRTEAVRRPMPWPVTGVDVALVDGTLLNPVADPPGATALPPVDEGHYEGSVPDPRVAEWTAQVTVHRSGRPDAVLLLPGSSADGGTTTPLELAAGGIALLLLAGTAAAVVVVRRRSQPGGGSSDGEPPSEGTIVPGAGAPDSPALEEANSR